MRSIRHRSRAIEQPPEGLYTFHFGSWTPAYRRWIEEDFGLTRTGKEWSFNGVVLDEYQSAMNTPENSYQVLTRLHKKLGFTHVCIPAIYPAICVINSTPRPTTLRTSLDEERTMQFVALAAVTIAAAGGKEPATLLDEELFVIRLPLPQLLSRCSRAEA